MPHFDRSTWPEYGLPHVLVFGGRDFANYGVLGERLDVYTAEIKPLVVVSGAAKGADRLGEQWAYLHRFTVVRFHPDWDRHGKGAGPIRNAEMAEFVASRPHGGYAIGFWNGKSSGTADMIERCRAHKIPLKVIRY